MIISVSVATAPEDLCSATFKFRTQHPDGRVPEQVSDLQGVLGQVALQPVEQLQRQQRVAPLIEEGPPWVRPTAKHRGPASDQRSGQGVAVRSA
jgi:hypothetical protein